MLGKKGLSREELLLEEYKICHEKAISLERNIYTSATVFLSGSIVSFTVLFTVLINNIDKISGIPEVYYLLGTWTLSLIAIGTWKAWLRLSTRWQGVSYTMIIRARYLEKKHKIAKANLYVAYLDDKSKGENLESFKELLGQDEILELDKYLENKGVYEHRSLFSMLNFMGMMNIVAWIGLGCLSTVRYFLLRFKLVLHFKPIALDIFLLITIILGTFLFISNLKKSWKKN